MKNAGDEEARFSLESRHWMREQSGAGVMRAESVQE